MQKKAKVLFQILTIMIVFFNLSLNQSTLALSNNIQSQNDAQITVSKSTLLNNIQFSYYSRLPTELNNSKTYHLNFNFTIVFTNISSSTNISRAVVSNSALSVFKQSFNYQNVSDLEVNHYYTSPSSVTISNYKVTFNENITVFLAGQFAGLSLYLSPSFTFVYGLNSTYNDQFVIWNPIQINVFNSSPNNISISSLSISQILFIIFVPSLLIMVLIFIWYKNKKKID